MPSETGSRVWPIARPVRGGRCAGGRGGHGPGARAARAARFRQRSSARRRGEGRREGQTEGRHAASARRAPHERMRHAPRCPRLAIRSLPRRQRPAASARRAARVFGIGGALIMAPDARCQMPDVCQLRVWRRRGARGPVCSACSGPGPAEAAACDSCGVLRAACDHAIMRAACVRACDAPFRLWNQVSLEHLGGHDRRAACLRPAYLRARSADRAPAHQPALHALHVLLERGNSGPPPAPALSCVCRLPSASCEAHMHMHTGSRAPAGTAAACMRACGVHRAVRWVRPRPEAARHARGAARTRRDARQDADAHSAPHQRAMSCVQACRTLRARAPASGLGPGGGTRPCRSVMPAAERTPARLRSGALDGGQGKLERPARGRPAKTDPGTRLARPASSGSRHAGRPGGPADPARVQAHAGTTGCRTAVLPALPGRGLGRAMRHSAVSRSVDQSISRLPSGSPGRGCPCCPAQAESRSGDSGERPPPCATFISSHLAASSRQLTLA